MPAATQDCKSPAAPKELLKSVEALKKACATVIAEHKWLADECSAADISIIYNSYPIKAAALHLWQTIYLLNGSTSPLACHILVPFATSFNAILGPNGRSRKVRDINAAWSRVLGQDMLPEALRSSSNSHQRNRILIAKSQQSYLACMKLPAPH
ncbi:hypothetical protein WJX74_000084 [Apatococcus lobatus]|uniref:Uncharacterized protein n=1 Tax=Apatococcus lobatus TaxID=904363 RepID=A0AAW1REC6_9CHLO